MFKALGLLSAFFFVTPAALATEFGRYEGSVIAQFKDDGLTMELLKDFYYTDPTGHRWHAPAGSIIDGASIPKPAWSFIGGPFEGQYRNASVIHDVACVKKSRPWKATHRAFYTGMLASGVSPTKAKVMYAAVYHFGPRWPDTIELHAPAGKTPPPTYKVSQADGSTDTYELSSARLSVGDDESGMVGIYVATEDDAPQAELTANDFERLRLQIEQSDPDITEIEAMRL